MNRTSPSCLHFSISGFLYLPFCFFILLFPNKTISQPKATFEPFRGTVYDIPGDYLGIGYGKHIPYCDVIGHITLDSLAVPKSYDYDSRFPGVNCTVGFGIIFLSKMEISQQGCYEFYLESDDGSILWIADSLIIDNDKPHKMVTKRDTMLLDKGVYDIKLWYYNAHATQYGLIFRTKPLPDSVSVKCGKTPATQKFELNSVLFDVNSSVITTPGMKELDKLCTQLNSIPLTKVSVIGYTDNTGTAEYNNELSLKRAQAVMKYIKTNITHQGVTMTAEGRGISKEIVSDQLSETQRLNRKVEIYIE
jgi:outer membrane protein OmpA-like peptidoglycan-associated protein